MIKNSSNELTPQNIPQNTPLELPIWIAPMEGLTLNVFRKIWDRHFGCGAIEKYYTPFLNANHTLHFQNKEIRDILPENNEGMPVAVQILTNKPDQLAWAVQEMYSYGYREVNFNLGCSMPQVARKKRGAGMLGDIDALDRFFEEFFDLLSRSEDPEIPSSMRISVKTRIGGDDRSTAMKLMPIYNRYPIDSLTIHPRLQCEVYSGVPDMDAFAAMYEASSHPVVYNGDILRAEDYHHIREQFPKLRAVMIGRGILRDPLLVRRITGAASASETSAGAASAGAASANEASEGAAPESPAPEDTAKIKSFHDDLLEAYLAYYPDERQALSKMKELWWYMRDSFPNKEREIRKLRKSSHLAEYRSLEQTVFR